MLAGRYYDLRGAMINLRHHRSRTWAFAGCIAVFLALLLLFQPTALIPSPFHWPSQNPFYHRAPQIIQKRPARLGRCVGPRGLSLDDPNSQDLPIPTAELPNVTFPEPAYGSYTELGLEQTWMTFSQRYGPYGYGEDDGSYPFSRVDWQSVNWGRLQDQCLTSTFTAQTAAPPRLRLLGDGDFAFNRTDMANTGRQAIVLRTWSTFDYTPEDMWNIRSLITEASLATNGQYTVVLLVDVKHPNGSSIHENDNFYREILHESVPAEFRDIAVLFHQSLLESWYEKVGEHRTIWQVMQPFQLFAYFYPEFDHYWQLEMDTRFTSHAGNMLSAFHKFGSKVPYKQSRERASWSYLPAVHGTYAEFAAKLNEAMEGGATVWGPVSIADVPNPVGRIPPMKATEDNFDFGIGWEADLLILSPLFEVKRFNKYEDWVFKDWIHGFSQFDWEVPRFSNAPAQARASRTLLYAVHDSQHTLGLRIPSEATLPSFALWNGLKVVQLPNPKFQWPSRSVTELNIVHNGGQLGRFKDGIANGAAPYMKSVIEFYSRPRTWEWQSSLVNPVFNRWINGDKSKGYSPSSGHASSPAIEHIPNESGSVHIVGAPGAGYDEEMPTGPNLGRDRRPEKRIPPASMGEIPDELPPFMAEVDGQVYCPGLLVHPRKTNKNP